jgi:Spy/CpxP family protein refolding chaperone
MRASLLKVVAFLALAAVFASAQHRTPPDAAEMAQHHINFLTKQLSLNAQQQQQATAIFSNMQNDAKNTHEQMRTAHENLKAAIQKNDAAGIEQAANTIGNLTAQMTAAHGKAQAAFYQTLTPEQQTRMSELESHHGGMRWHGGPGVFR